MRSVRVIYHHDPDGWWAECPEVRGYTGFGETYEEVRDQMREGLPWFAEEDLTLFHIAPSDEGKPLATLGACVSLDIVRQSPAPAMQPLEHSWNSWK